ncbi:hypothetical protein [Porphyromonas sp.]|uniref:hypothetical protein n=1 Tax=Porphyromonas sp. TaxID=1924944 RepID=UPI0026DBC0FA|nr:hypothetical protein [Porphyromonas sp.]MDO4771679.1 hypothetical protein [Porphyromonas sp.]
MPHAHGPDCILLPRYKQHRKTPLAQEAKQLNHDKKQNARKLIFLNNATRAPKPLLLFKILDH